jgi:hypothetical protein
MSLPQQIVDEIDVETLKAALNLNRSIIHLDNPSSCGLIRPSAVFIRVPEPWPLV